ncbi:hypothetical protein BDF20DRAFT_507095 [Mycotypha africana]|uniref:uncharacterized protein n=1 Tax=Mycotypha africana TaxID=64632 RepID=UPI0022FFEB3F|nr:uncharacterized protein BDF20DRAFT_507095 [Mycotypha africana]KAI8979448.1 hypothetical protein BDF20DRAFT_507095 [Mycotypha africana]
MQVTTKRRKAIEGVITSVRPFYVLKEKYIGKAHKLLTFAGLTTNIKDLVTFLR